MAENKIIKKDADVPEALKTEAMYLAAVKELSFLLTKGV
jgi:hypothetical protein